MSNIDVVKSLYEAFGRGDIASILANLAEDVRWESEAPAEISASGIRRGPQEVLGFFAGLDQDQTDPQLTVTDWLVTGDQVAAFGRYQATARRTGIRTDVPIAHLWTLKDGKVTRYVGLTDSATILQAL